MFAPHVIVFNDYCIPLRHVISLNGKYDPAEFKRWYYEHYSKFDTDQFVYCETLEEYVNLQTNMEKAQAYHLIAPLWVKTKRADNEALVIPDKMFCPDNTVEKAMETFVENHPYNPDDTKNDHVLHIWPRITKYSGCLKLDIIIWINQDDLPENEWEELYHHLSDSLLYGWGKTFTEQTIINSNKSELRIHFGENDRVKFHRVQF